VRTPYVFASLRDQIITTAIHAGHDLRSGIAARTQLDDATRLHEEDPHTERIGAVTTSTVVVHRSRFEVDLNRPRSHAVYRVPDDAWGLDLWAEPLPEHEIERSLVVYDEFYTDLERRLDTVAARGPFVVLDVHSYNHRRDGADAAAASAAENPDVNVGTGSLDHGQWHDLVDGFIADLRECDVLGHHLDVRENVRFRGGELSRWINGRYDELGCALAIEFKKTFMDEWTGAVDESRLEALRDALAATVPGLLATVGGT
jgi:N-formylglutamate amidohydrolase